MSTNFEQFFYKICKNFLVLLFVFICDLYMFLVDKSQQSKITCIICVGPQDVAYHI